MLRLLCGSGIASAGAELADGVVHKGCVQLFRILPLDKFRGKCMAP